MPSNVDPEHLVGATREELEAAEELARNVRAEARCYKARTQFWKYSFSITEGQLGHCRALVSCPDGKEYSVFPDSCSCVDHTRYKGWCKHRLMVMYWLRGSITCASCFGHVPLAEAKVSLLALKDVYCYSCREKMREPEAQDDHFPDTHVRSGNDSHVSRDHVLAILRKQKSKRKWRVK